MKKDLGMIQLRYLDIAFNHFIQFFHDNIKTIRRFRHEIKYAVLRDILGSA